MFSVSLNFYSILYLNIWETSNVTKEFMGNNLNLMFQRKLEFIEHQLCLRYYKVLYACDLI